MAEESWRYSLFRRRLRAKNTSPRRQPISRQPYLARGTLQARDRIPNAGRAVDEGICPIIFLCTSSIESVSGVPPTAPAMDTTAATFPTISGYSTRAAGCPAPLEYPMSTTFSFCGRSAARRASRISAALRVLLDQPLHGNRRSGIQTSQCVHVRTKRLAGDAVIVQPGYKEVRSLSFACSERDGFPVGGSPARRRTTSSRGGHRAALPRGLLDRAIDLPKTPAPILSIFASDAGVRVRGGVSSE